jgi:hypothetical protein
VVLAWRERGQPMCVDVSSVEVWSMGAVVFLPA